MMISSSLAKAYLLCATLYALLRGIWPKVEERRDNSTEYIERLPVVVREGREMRLKMRIRGRVELN